MAELERALRDIVAALRLREVSFALVGGLAVAVRGEPRLTRDADLAVSVASDADAETLVHSLLVDGYSVHSAIEHQVTGRLATIRLERASGHRAVVTDLLFASCGIEREITTAAEPVEVLAGLTLPVARTGHLIVMKVLARDDRRRPADADDLVGLSLVATEEEWEIALDGARLVAERGYDRGRDVAGAVQELRDNPGRVAF